MDRKLIAVVFTIIIIAMSIIFLLTVLHSSPIETTILEIVSDPKSWVNKQVRVKGTMIGPLIYIPERIPPYNYLLQDKDNRTIEIGSYSGENQETSAYVTVFGIVKAGYTRGLRGGDLVYYVEVQKIVAIDQQELEAYSCSCEGDVEQLIIPWSYAVDGDWSTKVEWNTTPVGDSHVDITQNFIVPSSFDSLKWKFKAYHVSEGSLMPTPMEISYWNGSLWKRLHALDDQDHVNEIFVETIDVPQEAFSNGIIRIRTTIRYSSHVTGLGQAQQLWHYVEFFEGKVMTDSV